MDHELGIHVVVDSAYVCIAGKIVFTLTRRYHLPVSASPQRGEHVLTKEATPACDQDARAFADTRSLTLTERRARTLSCAPSVFHEREHTYA
jgi:hypothetical protein